MDTSKYTHAQTRTPLSRGESIRLNWIASGYQSGWVITGPTLVNRLIGNTGPEVHDRVLQRGKEIQKMLDPDTFVESIYMTFFNKKGIDHMCFRFNMAVPREGKKLQLRDMSTGEIPLPEGWRIHTESFLDILFQIFFSRVSWENRTVRSLRHGSTYHDDHAVDGTSDELEEHLDMLLAGPCTVRLLRTHMTLVSESRHGEFETNIGGIHHWFIG